jgi:hypothetical protein
MNATPTNPRKLVYTLLITVAAAAAAGRIVATERVLEPSLHKGPGETKGRIWPPQKPRPTPMFSSNDVSRWATVRALVDHGTYAIGRRDKDNVLVSAVAAVAATNAVDAAVLTQLGFYIRSKKSDHGVITEPGWESVDKVLHPERLEWYSSKPPLLATLVAGLYWLLKMLTGWTLADHPAAAVRTILLLINGGLFVVYLALLARLLDRYAQTDWTRYFVLAAACFATLVTPFLITFNNHTLATFGVVFALYPALRILESGPAAPWWSFALAGFFAAFTACLELPAASFAVALGAILFWVAPRRTLLAFLPAALIPVAAFFLTNYLAIGQWRPAYSEFRSGYERDPSASWYQYEGSHWRTPNPGEVRSGIDWAWTQESRPTYAWHLLFGHHGLFSLTPLWLLAVWGMARFSLAGLGVWLSRRPLPTDGTFSPDNGAPVPDGPRCAVLNLVAGMTLVLSVVVVGFYLVKSNNYGGWTSGLRWLMWLSPLSLLCLVPVADYLAGRRWGRALALVLLALSIFSVSYPAWNPWRHPWIFRLMEALGWPGYG